MVPSLVAFDYFLLTELLFTVLLITSVWLTVGLVQAPSAARAVQAGTVIGLGALTRSVLWPYPILLAPLLLFWVPLPRWRRLGILALLLGAYAAVVLPWSVRNLRVQHAFVVVDALGGYNLRMGNYEHTLEDRMWDTVALTGEKNWSWELTQEHPAQHFTDGQKEKWAQRKALAYMMQHPGVTARRSLIRFADFWGLEREVVAGFRNGTVRAAAVVRVGGHGGHWRRVSHSGATRGHRDLVCWPPRPPRSRTPVAAGALHHRHAHDCVRALALSSAAHPHLAAVRRGRRAGA